MFVLLGAEPTWADKGVFWVLTAQLVLLAIVGYIAWRQLRAQIRPFVVVDLDVQRAPFIQLVIANLGTTMARDVKFDFNPPLESALGAKRSSVPIADVSLFKDGIPSFPPGKKLTVLFDDGRDRTSAGLPDKFQATIRYRGEPFGRQFEDRMTLDIGMYREWGAIRRKEVHEVAQEIQKLREKIVSQRP
ncbi:MAG: hypothetical protein ACRDNP_00910 [Gaiellaceae bacterium]